MENEFHIGNNGNDPHYIAEAMLAGHFNAGQTSSRVNDSGFSTRAGLDSVLIAGNIPLLTIGQEVN